MGQGKKMKSGVWLFCLTGLLASLPALADKPSWAGDKGAKHGREAGRSEMGHRYFSDESRQYLHQYYAERFRYGTHCPPGLSKKHNGCMPPGQARKWAIGKPLPPDVEVYELPSGVVTQIGPPPAGHRYVRVAGDILLIAIGTALVVDAVEDLGR